MVKVNQKAPDFCAQAYHQGKFVDVSLSDYRGKWVILFFYPLDFTFVCPTEIEEFARNYDSFRERNAEVIGASVDSVYSHKAWFETDKRLKGVRFPVLSDIKREISLKYGVLDEGLGAALRGTFIIDPEGIIKYAEVITQSTGRSVKNIMRVLKALQTGELCPVEWDEGKETIKVK